MKVSDLLASIEHRRYVSSLARYILRDRRRYFIDKVKAPLLMAIVKYALRYPEPTRENIKKHNSLILLEIWEAFERYNQVKPHLFHAAKRLSIGEYEHDGVYSSRMDWLLEKLVEKHNSGEWWPRKPWLPADFWEEPTVVEERIKMQEDLMADINIKGENNDTKDITVAGIRD
jgi:hypothetical protein